MTTWARWLIDAAGTDASTAIAKKTGINQSSVYRWLNEGSSPKPAHAARVAQAYGRDVLEAFVAAEILTAEEAGIVDPLQRAIENAQMHVENARMILMSAESRLADLKKQWAKRQADIRGGVDLAARGDEDEPPTNQSVKP